MSSAQLASPFSTSFFYFKSATSVDLLPYSPSSRPLFLLPANARSVEDFRATRAVDPGLSAHCNSSNQDVQQFPPVAVKFDTRMYRL
jgi:hypothetical protein